MKATVENINSVQQKINVIVPTEKVNEAFTDSFKRIQKKAKLQGFRPGKAPLSLIKRQYKEQVAYEISENLIKNNIFTAIKEHKLKPISSPNVENVDFPEQDKIFKFTAVIDIFPEINIGDKYKQLNISHPVRKFREESLAEELKKIARSHAKSKPLGDPNTAASKNMLAVVSYQTNYQGQKLPQLSAEKSSVALGHQELMPEIEEVVLGLKINETKEDNFDAPTSYQDSKIAGKNLNITMTLHELKTLSIPSLDDELAKDLNFESFQKLQETIETNLQKQIAQQNKEAKEAATFDELHKKISFEVPPVMVDQVIDNIINTICRTEKDKKQTLQNKDIRKSIAPEARRRAKNTLVLYEIAKNEKITISDDSIKQFINQNAPKGSDSGSKQEIESIFEKNKEKIREDLLFEKTLEKIVSYATINTTPEKTNQASN